MKFLKQFDVQNQEILRNSARILRLDPGQYLLRRGDPGGDIYVVQTGTLEVVDTRSTPEVILAYLEPGDVVGEMAFVDDSPRSADVRAGGLVQILHWPRDDMHRLLQLFTAFCARSSSGRRSRRTARSSPNRGRGTSRRATRRFSGDSAGSEGKVER